MGFFERHKALIITLLLFSILLLAMVNIRLVNSKDELTSTLIDLASFREPMEETEREDIEAPEPTPVQHAPPVETHQAYNQDQQESQSLDSRLQEIFNKNSANSTASEEDRMSTNTGEVNLDKNTQKERVRESAGEGTSEAISNKTGSLRNSSISFSLLSRSALSIPNPIYTCDNSGKVVVNIKVDAEGMVTSTSINHASSTSKNECLTEKALEYAAQARFSPLVGRNEQPGTITYNFQG